MILDDYLIDHAGVHAGDKIAVTHLIDLGLRFVKEIKKQNHGQADH